MAPWSRHKGLCLRKPIRHACGVNKYSSGAHTTHRLQYHLVWADGYFAESVGRVTEARIKAYIQNQ